MKFGVREICDVTFKATSTGQKIGAKTFKAGQPAFFIDSAKTSSLEQATTTVYAQGGRGNARLIAWEGEKTMTFTVEDALISPQGLAILSGAGLMNAEEKKLQHVHVTLDKVITKGKVEITLDDLAEELGTGDTYGQLLICSDIPVYATQLDGSGAGIEYFDTVKFVDATGAEIDFETKEAVEGYDYVSETTKEGDVIVDDDKKAYLAIYADEKAETLVADGTTVKLDFYVAMPEGVTNITIAPEDFGGFYYVEADTLFRAEATGKDMAATITIPKAKVQSAMTFTMASSGDPSTFTFTMDAFPAYTYFDRTKKVMCTIQIVGTDGSGKEDRFHTHSDVDTHEKNDETKSI